MAADLGIREAYFKSGPGSCYVPCNLKEKLLVSLGGQSPKSRPQLLRRGHNMDLLNYIHFCKGELHESVKPYDGSFDNAAK